MAWLSKLILNLIGWKITGNYRLDIKKKMLIVAPHTSNWDFPLGLLVRSALRDNIRFVGKDSLFKPPFGFIMKAIGGIPVDRSRSTNFVRAVVNRYSTDNELTIVMAPEGSRKKVKKFKTGYYFIAKAAKIPIIKVKFDYGKKEVHFDDPFYTTEDSEADLQLIENHFKGIKGLNNDKSFQ